MERALNSRRWSLTAETQTKKNASLADSRLTLIAPDCVDSPSSCGMSNASAEIRALREASRQEDCLDPQAFTFNKDNLFVDEGDGATNRLVEHPFHIGTSNSQLAIHDAALVVFRDVLAEVQQVKLFMLTLSWWSSIVVLEDLELSKQFLHLSAEDPMRTLHPRANEFIVLLTKGPTEKHLDEGVIDSCRAVSTTGWRHVVDSLKLEIWLNLCYSVGNQIDSATAGIDNHEALSRPEVDKMLCLAMLHGELSARLGLCHHTNDTPRSPVGKGIPECRIHGSERLVSSSSVPIRWMCDDEINGDILQGSIVLATDDLVRSLRNDLEISSNDLSRAFAQVQRNTALEDSAIIEPHTRSIEDCALQVDECREAVRLLELELRVPDHKGLVVEFEVPELTIVLGVGEYRGDLFCNVTSPVLDDFHVVDSWLVPRLQRPSDAGEGCTIVKTDDESGNFLLVLVLVESKLLLVLVLVR